MPVVPPFPPVPPTPIDPLSALDDDFQGNSLNPKWLIYKPAALAAATVGGGYLLIEIVDGGPGPTGSFWFNDNDGVQIYQLVAGDFIAEIFLELRNAADSGPPPLADFNVGILQARDPSGAPLPVGFNYIHDGPAANATASYQNEDKSTAASVSTFDYVAEPVVAQWQQITRIGQTFSCAYKLNAGDPWIPRTVYDRSVMLPVMPNVLALGPGVYTNNVVGDVSVRCSFFTVRTP